MNITTTTTHNLKFHVADFWNEEGGMGEATYGEQVETLEQAIEILKSAELVNGKNHNWRIVVDLTTITK